MSRRKNPDSANVALCYVRKSLTRDEKDYISPERQRAHIQRVCDDQGWITEWYEDVEGHKSGREEENRPGWMALKTRLADPDVIALVADDLSRLHRNSQHVRDLVDYVREYDVKLILAAPGRYIDFSTPYGRAFAYFSALFDQWYAEDISIRARQSAEHKRKEGKVLGLPPFGTIRDANGYLAPSREGAWLLPDGSFVKGERDNPPQPEAIWRSYYFTAMYILSLYADGEDGTVAIAYRMQREGYPYRDRKGNPTAFEQDDIRRIVANWPEYGGYISGKRARERVMDEYEVDNITLNPDRAVFPVNLLYEVGRVRAKRTSTYRRPHDVKNYPYLLSQLVYCSYCMERAERENNPKLRTFIKNRAGNIGLAHYYHRTGLLCGREKHSVRAFIIDPQAVNLLKSLTLLPPPQSTQVSETPLLPSHKPIVGDLYKTMRELNILRQRYINQEMTWEEYVRRQTALREQQDYWKLVNANVKTALDFDSMEYEMCRASLHRIQENWDTATPVEKQGMMREIFDYLVYNLDEERFTDFRLKPWAERFITRGENLNKSNEESNHS